MSQQSQEKLYCVSWNGFDPKPPSHPNGDTVSRYVDADMRISYRVDGNGDAVDIVDFNYPTLGLHAYAGRCKWQAAKEATVNDKKRKSPEECAHREDTHTRCMMCGLICCGKAIQESFRTLCSECLQLEMAEIRSEEIGEMQGAKKSLPLENENQKHAMRLAFYRQLEKDIDKLWDAHRNSCPGNPFLSGAECSFLIEAQREAKKHAEKLSNATGGDDKLLRGLDGAKHD